MEGSPSATAPLLLRNLLCSLFFHADKSLIYLVDNFRFLRILRRLLVAAFLFFLQILPSLFPSLSPSAKPHGYPQDPSEDDAYHGGGGDSGIARALTQLLLIMNDIPVSSRKYEVVRSLAEKLIDGNLGENNQTLRDVNCAVLSTAFARTLSQLEGASAEQGRRGGGEGGGHGVVAAGVNENGYYFCLGASRIVRGVRSMGRVMLRYAKPGEELSRSSNSAEKLAAELLWLAQKMAASGCASEAVRKWASASKLSGLATTAEPRLQGSLVKTSAFLIKQAKEMGKEEEEEEEDGEAATISSKRELHEMRQTKMKMLISWLPLLCRANNGTDAPIITMSERAELEKVMEDIIRELDEEEEQERVLSVWLHHFTYCSASDWPNLRSCYTRWLDATRTRLLQSSSRTT